MGTLQRTVKLWNTVAEEILSKQGQNFRNPECVWPGSSLDGQYIVIYEFRGSIVDATAVNVTEWVLISSFNVVSLGLDVDVFGLAIETRGTNIYF